MPTLLVTGFGAFPGAPFNPSAEIVAALERYWRPRFSRVGVRLVTSILPVAYAIAPHLDALVARETPDAILHLGLAGSRRKVCVETRARNVASRLKPDAFGVFVERRALARGARPFRASGWDAGELVAALRRRGVDAVASIDAGDYVCNATLWRTLETGRAPAVFVHVPKKRRLAPARMAEALAAILPATTLRLARRCPRRGQPDR